MEKKPPTESKPSAEEEEAPNKLDARLCQLTEDSWAAFFRDRTEENLQRAQLLSAISHSPERRSKLAQHERQLAGKVALTNPPHPRKFWRTVWVRLIPDLVAAEENDSEVARLLIGVLPAWLQAKCPKYPTNEAKLEAAVAAVIAEENFVPELCKCRGEGPWNPLLVARAVLRGLGMTKNDAKSLLRTDQWEAWLREHGAP
jgi:hypothetical protein